MGAALSHPEFDRHEQLARDVIDHIGRGGDIVELAAMVDGAEVPALLLHFVAVLAYRQGYVDGGGNPGDWLR